MQAYPVEYTEKKALYLFKLDEKINELGIFLKLDNENLGMEEVVYNSLIDIVLKDNDDFFLSKI